MTRAQFLQRAAWIAAGVVAADQLELLERLAELGPRRLFPSAEFPEQWQVSGSYVLDATSSDRLAKLLKFRRPWIREFTLVPPGVHELRDLQLHNGPRIHARVEGSISMRGAKAWAWEPEVVRRPEESVFARMTEPGRYRAPLIGDYTGRDESWASLLVAECPAPLSGGRLLETVSRLQGLPLTTT